MTLSSCAVDSCVTPGDTRAVAVIHVVCTMAFHVMMYMGKGLVVKESTVILAFLNTALMYFLSLCTIVIMALYA